jgi:hypothetical protein
MVLSVRGWAQLTHRFSASREEELTEPCRKSPSDLEFSPQSHNMYSRNTFNPEKLLASAAFKSGLELNCGQLPGRSRPGVRLDSDDEEPPRLMDPSICLSALTGPRPGSRDRAQALTGGSRDRRPRRQPR